MIVYNIVVIAFELLRHERRYEGLAYQFRETESQLRVYEEEEL